MTVIAGFSNGKKVWLGADRMFSNGLEPPYSGSKINRILVPGKNDWGFAISGESWLSQASQKISRETWEKDDPYEVCRSLRTHILEEGWQSYEHKGAPKSFNISAILTNSEKLWFIDSDFYPHEVETDRLVGGGCGFDYALGANEALTRDIAPRDRVKKCLEIANKLSPRCGLGIDIEVFQKK